MEQNICQRRIVLGCFEEGWQIRIPGHVVHVNWWWRNMGRVQAFNWITFFPIGFLLRTLLSVTYLTLCLPFPFGPKQWWIIVHLSFVKIRKKGLLIGTFLTFYSGTKSSLVFPTSLKRRPHLLDLIRLNTFEFEIFSPGMPTGNE